MRFITVIPTTQRLVSIVDPDLHERVRREAARQRKSVSRYVRELVAERLLPPPSPRRGRKSSLLELCGLAHGELVVRNIDRELYES